MITLSITYTIEDSISIAILGVLKMGTALQESDDMLCIQRKNALYLFLMCSYGLLSCTPSNTIKAPSRRSEIPVGENELEVSEISAHFLRSNPTQAVVSWRTSKPSRTQVKYGYGHQEIQAGTFLLSPMVRTPSLKHTHTLVGLRRNMVVHLELVSEGVQNERNTAHIHITPRTCQDVEECAGGDTGLIDLHEDLPPDDVSIGLPAGSSPDENDGHAPVHDHKNATEDGVKEGKNIDDPGEPTMAAQEPTDVSDQGPGHDHSDGHPSEPAPSAPGDEEKNTEGSKADDMHHGGSVPDETSIVHAHHNMGGPDDDFVRGHTDSVPNFGKLYTIINIADGSWSHPATWNTGSVPKQGDIVRIAKNTTVSYDHHSGEAHTIGIDGTLRFVTDKDTRLKVKNILVYRDGTFEIGTKSEPLKVSARAEIIIANQDLDTVDDGEGVFDPEQFGNGIVVFGKVRIHGRPLKNTFLRMANNAEPISGDGKLMVAEDPVGWRPNDRIVIPDTRNKKGGRIEERRIASISGKEIALDSPLSYDHLGARDAEGHLDILPHVVNMTRNVVIRSEQPEPERNRGHVIVFGRADAEIYFAELRHLGRTKNSPLDSTIFQVDLLDTETGKIYTVEVAGGKAKDPRAELPKHWALPVVNHGVLVFPDRPNVHQVGAWYPKGGSWKSETIGTNQIARYALHAHHVTGPRRAPRFDGFQFQFVGNAIDGGGFGKWGLVIHASHYGLIQNNIVYDVEGSGFVTEDGSETRNTFDGNFALRIQTKGGSGSTSSSKHGTSGDGFWFRGNNNYVRNNVSANTNGFGYTYFQQEPKASERGLHWVIGTTNRITIPKFPGADLGDPEETEVVNGQTETMAQCDNNEAYASHTGMNLWTLSMAQRASSARKLDPRARNVIRNLKLWHMNFNGIFFYAARNLTIDNYLYRGYTGGLTNPDYRRLTFQGISRGSAILGGGTALINGEISGADIQGIHTGILVTGPLAEKDGPPGSLLIEDSLIRAHIGMEVSLYKGGSSQHASYQSRTISLKNTSFGPLLPEGFVLHEDDHPDIAIHMADAPYVGKRAVTQMNLDVVRLETVSIFRDHQNKNVIHNGQVYYRQQAPSYIVPKTYTTESNGMVTAAPVAGLTTLELLNNPNFGITTAGEVASCETQIANVVGLVCD